MALYFRLATDGRLLPKNVAGAAVEAVDDEALWAFVVDGCDVSVEAEDGGRAALGGLRAREEVAVRPDDGAGVANSRDGRFPSDIYPSAPFHSTAGEPSPKPLEALPRYWGQFDSAPRAVANRRSSPSFMPIYV